MPDFTYRHGDRVRYRVTPTLQGEGTVVGCSAIPVSLVGATYMIKPDVSCYNEEYPFEIMPCLEYMMEPLAKLSVKT